ncbi:MAG: hypothetical protein ABH828_00365 [archaeon]
MSYRYLNTIVQINENGEKGSVSDSVLELLPQDENLQKVVEESKSYGAVVGVVYTIGENEVSFSEWKEQRDKIKPISNPVIKQIAKYLTHAPYSGKNLNKHITELKGIGPIVSMNNNGRPIHDSNEFEYNGEFRMVVTELHHPDFYNKNVKVATSNNNNTNKSVAEQEKEKEYSLTDYNLSSPKTISMGLTMILRQF